MPLVFLPIPPATQAEVAKLLEQALAKLTPLALTLTDAERRTLSAPALGPGSVAFAQEAGLLLAHHPEVLRRTITDADIAAYPALLDTFSAATSLKVLAEGVLALLNTITLVTGTKAMGTARIAYTDGKGDKGRTPGVHPIIGRMSERFAQDSPETDS